MQRQVKKQFEESFRCIYQYDDSDDGNDRWTFCYHLCNCHVFNDQGND